VSHPSDYESDHHGFELPVAVRVEGPEDIATAWLKVILIPDAAREMRGDLARFSE